MNIYASALLLLGIVALVAGIVLTLAAKFMAVPVDETAVKIRECLPGANCGACGYAGCDDYAGALAADPDNVRINACIPGGGDVASAIGVILGKDAGSAEPLVARVHCRGIDGKAKEAMEYHGLKTCKASKEFFGGHGVCKYGCIGYGDCVQACAFGAIDVIDGVAVVNRSKCVGCGACAAVCPNQVIDVAPASARVFVGCSSQDKGAVTRKACDTGCIGCMKCVKTCKFEAVQVVDNHAVIDPAKCKNCGMCAKECPMNIITVVPKNVI